MGKWKSEYNETRKYRKEWESEFPWLTLLDGSCFCKLCQIKIPKFKKFSLVVHERTIAHQANHKSGYDVDLNPIVGLTSSEEHIAIGGKKSKKSRPRFSPQKSIKSKNIKQDPQDNIEEEFIPSLDYNYPNENDGESTLLYQEGGHSSNWQRVPVYATCNPPQSSGDLSPNCILPAPLPLSVKLEDKIQGSDGSFIYVHPQDALPSTANYLGNVNVDPSQYDPDDAQIERLLKLTSDVSEVFKMDLEKFLMKNQSVYQSIANNPEFSEGTLGMSRVTRLLVGQLAQQYLVEATIESWKTGKPMSSRSNVSSKLAAIEQSIEKSVSELKKMKEQLEKTPDKTPPVPTSSPIGIVLDSINVDL